MKTALLVSDENAASYAGGSVFVKVLQKIMRNGE